MSILLKTFNSEFLNFFNEIILIYPDEIDLKIAKKSFLAMKKINPKLIIVNFYNYVTVKYKTQILNKNIDSKYKYSHFLC